MAAMFSFKIWIEHIAEDYIQATEIILREIYTKHVQELYVRFEELFGLVKPFYGLPDANDYQNWTITEHPKSDLHKP